MLPWRYVDDTLTILLHTETMEIGHDMEIGHGGSLLFPRVELRNRASKVSPKFISSLPTQASYALTEPRG